MLGLIKICAIHCNENLGDFLNNGISAEISADLKVLTVQQNCQSIFGLVLRGIEKSNLDEPVDATHFTVEGFSWHKHQENGGKTNHYILVGNHCGEMKLLNIVNNEKLVVQTLYTWSLRDIDSQIILFEKDTELDYKVLAYRGNNAIICIQKQTILKVIVSHGQSIYVKFQFSLTEDGSKSRHIQCLNNIVCTLSNDGMTISAYDLENGGKQWQYSLLSDLNVSKFYLSTNSNYLVLVKEDESVYLTDLLSNNFKRPTTTKSLKSVITAFSKQSVALTSKEDGKTRIREKELLNISSRSTKDALALENRVYICSTDKMFGEFHSYLYDGTLEFKEKFSSGCLIVHSSDNCCPPLILSEDMLYTYSPESTTTDFVNKLMMYSSGHTVEYLSLLNEWQGISIELDVLELGLKNIQLDTATFFLRVKCEEFRTLWKNLYNGATSTDILNVKLENWIKIFGMLEHSLEQKLNSNSFVQFAEQILKVTISILIHLVKTVTTDFPVPPEKLTDTPKPDILFTHYLKLMRQFVQSKIDADVKVPELNFQNASLESWSSLSEEDIIRESLTNSHVPIAMWYFKNRAINSVTLSNVQELARKFSIGFLEGESFSDATKVLVNSGLEPTEVFINVFRTTTEKRLRNFLLPHLNNSHCSLPRDDLDGIEFVHLLEELYPCDSFERAKVHILNTVEECFVDYPIQSQLKIAKEYNSNDILPTPLLQRKLNDLNSGDNFSYCRISLDVVKILTEMEKEEILVPALLAAHKVNPALSPSPNVIWNYLLKRNSLTRLLNWILVYYEPNASPERGSFPHGWPLSIEMVNSVISSSATIVVKENVLDAFAKYGIVCEDELEDVNLLLKRLESAGVLLAKPHPFGRPGASMKESDYYHRIVHYCLEHSLFNFLYYFLQEDGRYRLCTFCPVCSVSLVLAMIDFCRWSENPSNELLRYQAILSTSCLLNNTSESSLGALCKTASGPTTMAAMIFSPLNLSQILENNFTECDRNFKDDFENAISTFPILNRVLAKGWPSKNNSDVTIYSLLMGNCFFDPSRLFGWQSANTIASEDAPSEIPHFSSPHLVQQHALNQNIDVNYYLVEGRPSYAYLKFVSQELLTWKNLSNQRLTLAYKEVCILALQNYATPKIAASCVAFVELLGMSSLKLRVDIQIASILHNEQFAINEVKENKNLVALLVNMMESKESTKEVAEIVDSVISKKIDLINKPQNYEFYLILLLGHFCQCHHLEYLPTYFDIIAQRKDWFTLTILLQVLMVRREWALEIVQKIPDRCLVDHLTTAFQSLRPNYGTKARLSETRTRRVAKRVEPKVEASVNVRSVLYHKIGLSQNASPQPSPMDTSDDDTVASDDGSSSANTTDENSSIDEYFGQPKDLFEQIILASKSANPGLTLLQTSILFANPIHALISASLTNTDWLLCSCAWIIAILKLEQSVPTEEIYPGKIKVSNFTVSDLSALMVTLVELGYLKILNRCALFFLPHSPILPLTDFLVTFFYAKKFTSSIKKLEGFKSKMEDFKSSLPIEHTIGNVKWTESTVLKLVKASLISCKSYYECKTFLHQLSVSDFGVVFSTTEPFDYHGLYSLLQCVEDCNVGFPMKELLSSKDDPIFVSAAFSVVTNLQMKKMYDQGRQFGSICHLPKGKLIATQLNFEADSLDESFGKRKNFWEYCDKTFDVEEIEPSTVVNYFNNWCEKALTYVERYYILVIIVKWSKKAGAIDLAEKEMAMWLSCFQCKMESLLKNADSEHTELVIDSYAGNSVELFDWELWDFDSISLEPLQLKFGTEKMALDEILLKLLDLGYVGQAWKLAIMFRYFSLELEAVLSCLKLVREVCLPSQIHSKVVEMINFSVDVLETNPPSVMDVLDKIQQSLEHGKIACQRIKIHYQASQMLWTPYTQIAAEDSIRLFVNLLNCSNPGKLNLAKELCRIRKIPDCDIVNCIYNEISGYVQKSVILAGAQVADLSLGKSNKGNIAFSQQVFQLCKEPSLLGYKLLGDIASNEDDSDYKKCHIYQVAICVSCHACFTSCCCMEGISKTLRKAHQLTLELEEKKEFSLMLSLLTGIGRYGEMTYIFDILREHEQFDILLKKSTEELPLLRLALLDYLKRHHEVSDREAQSMLAVKFKMFREIAEMLERSAKDRLKKLVPSDLSKPNFRSTLATILQDLEASTKKYLEDGCVRHAQNCLKLAELVALQIHLSHSGTWILSLDEPAVHKFLVEHKQFLHSLIVASAYQHHRSWDEALYQNLIEKGDWDYFRDFQANLPLNPAVIGGVARRFSLSTNKGERQQHNMKRLLNLCEDVVARYQIANQLGFMDITSDLLKGDAGAYLQDIISQRKLQDDWLLTSI